MMEWTSATTPGIMYKQIVVHVSVFLYSPFSNIGGVFCCARQSGGQVWKIAISLQ